MAPVTVHWNVGMTVATLLLITGGTLVVIAEDMESPLWRAGVGILTLASVVYLGARIWMMLRRHNR